MQIAVIWNARAGSAAGVTLDDVVQRLATIGVVTVHEVTDDHGPDACARAAIASGAELVVAAGGDGTVSSVAAVLVGGTAKLGVLPLGTSNSFAAALAIPDDVGGALDMIAAGNQRVIDAAVVRTAVAERVMVLHCMIGFHAQAISGTSTEAKRRWGVLAYAGSAIRELATLTPFAVELETGGHVVRCRATAVAAANLAPVKTVLAHGASHLLGDDGKVDVTIVAAETIAEAIATGIHLYRSARDGEAATRDNVGSFSVARVAITAEPPQAVLVDGEPFGETPVTIETLPAALVVFAPPPEPADGPPVEASLIGLPELEIDGMRLTD
ncbi:MAG: NAD(+)/NADH kinase [Deltaproteobacteria bacterium]|nr:NAD(+)/NADH kinase [Deltaproteobacteria bacterium]